MVLDKKEVDAILYTLIENEYVDGSDVYDKSETDRQDVAYFWIQEAEKAWHQNRAAAKNDEAIRTILNIVGVPEDQEYHAPGVTDKLPKPKEPDFDYEHLPADFTTLTDVEIRRYSSHNQHYLNRARYLLANVTNHLADATHLRDDAYRKAYIEATASLEKATRDLIDSYARGDEVYKSYDSDVKDAQKNVTELKALVEIYSGNVERLSREWTMRQNEWEKTR